MFNLRLRRCRNWSGTSHGVFGDQKPQPGTRCVLKPGHEGRHRDSHGTVFAQDYSRVPFIIDDCIESDDYQAAMEGSG